MKLSQAESIEFWRVTEHHGSSLRVLNFFTCQDFRLWIDFKVEINAGEVFTYFKALSANFEKLNKKQRLVKFIFYSSRTHPHQTIINL